MAKEVGPQNEEAHAALLPREEASSTTPWGRFWLVWIACSLSSGVIPGQALFSELLTSAGVYGSMCRHGDVCHSQYMILSGVFQCGSTVTLLGLLPIGIVFDRFGSQITATLGSVICAAGLFMLFGCVRGAEAGMDASTSPFFPIALLTTDVGSFLNSYAMYGFLWEFSDRQTLVIAMMTTTYQFSAVFPICIKSLMHSTGVTLSFCMCAWGVMVVGMAFVCWVCVPTQEEYFSKAKQVLGMPLPKPGKNSQLCSMIKEAWETLRLDIVDHLMCVMAMSGGFILVGCYSTLTMPFGEALFGRKVDGAALSSCYVWVTAILGCSAAPLCAAFADKFGLTALLFILVVATVGSFVTACFANWPCQIVCQCCLVTWQLLSNVFISRYLLNYSSPNRYGAVVGLLCVIIVFGSMPCEFIALGFISSWENSLDAYRYPYIVAGFWGAAAHIAFAAYYMKNPPPDIPQLLGEDEFLLAKGFGCENLDEVAYITHSPSKKAVIQQLAKADADSIRTLIGNIDTSRMMEMMSRRSADHIAAMMEEGADEEDPEEDEEPAERANDMRTLVVLDGERGIETCNTEKGDDTEKDATEKDDTQKDVAEKDYTEKDDTEKEAGKAVGTQNMEEPKADVVAELDKKMMKALEAKDKAALTKLFMEEDVGTLDKVFARWETIYTSAEMKQREKEFNKIISNKEFAKMLRARKELKMVVQNMMKRDFDRKKAKLMGKK